MVLARTDGLDELSEVVEASDDADLMDMLSEVVEAGGETDLLDAVLEIGTKSCVPGTNSARQTLVDGV